MVKKWFPQNTFFSWFFTGGAFIMVYYIIKLVLEFQFDLQNPLKQPKMWIFEKWKIIVFGQNYGIFRPKGDLKPHIVMYLGNIHNVSLVPVTFGKKNSNPPKMALFGLNCKEEKRPWNFCPTLPNFFASKIGVKLPSKNKVPWHFHHSQPNHKIITKNIICHDRPSFPTYLQMNTAAKQWLCQWTISEQWTGENFLVCSFVMYLFCSSDFPHAEINSIIALSLDTLDIIWNMDYQCAIVGATGLQSCL